MCDTSPGSPIYMGYNVSEAPGAMQWSSSGKKVRMLTGAKPMRGMAKLFCMRTWEKFYLVLEREKKREKDQNSSQREVYVMVEGCVVHRLRGQWEKSWQWDINRNVLNVQLIEVGLQASIFSKISATWYNLLFQNTLGWERGTEQVLCALACVKVTGEIKG